jgi:DNA-binding response OmpR family regulator
MEKRPLKKYKILGIDDDPRIGTLLKSKLDKNKFEITVATTMKEFLGLYKEGPWDLFLIDLNLEEGMEAGFTVVEYLRLKLNEKRPILIFSKIDEVGKIAHGLECGANDFISKPFDLPIFMDKLSNFLEQEDKEGSGFSFSKVPTQFQKCKVLTSVNLVSLTETELVISGQFFLSKGTSVKIENSLLNEYLGMQTLLLVVIKNTMDENKKFHLTLEFDQEEAQEMAKNFLGHRKHSQAS